MCGGGNEGNDLKRKNKNNIRSRFANAGRLFILGYYRPLCYDIKPGVTNANGGRLLVNFKQHSKL